MDFIVTQNLTEHTVGLPVGISEGVEPIENKNTVNHRFNTFSDALDFYIDVNILLNNSKLELIK